MLSDVTLVRLKRRFEPSDCSLEGCGGILSPLLTDCHSCMHPGMGKSCMVLAYLFSIRSEKKEAKFAFFYLYG